MHIPEQFSLYTSIDIDTTYSQLYVVKYLKSKTQNLMLQIIFFIKLTPRKKLIIKTKYVFVKKYLFTIFFFQQKLPLNFSSITFIRITEIK